MAPEMVPWLSIKSEGQSGGPRKNMEVFGDEVSFQYFQKMTLRKKKNKRETGKLPEISFLFIKWLPFLCIFVGPAIIWGHLG